MATPPYNPLVWTLREIARLERSDLRPARLTEPDRERWHRVRRKLGWVAFIELLHEDLAEAFPTAFALDRWKNHPTASLDEASAKVLIQEAGHADDSDTLAFLRAMARGVGLMDGGNVAALPKVQTHQQALELPGCAGRIAAHQATTHAGLSFREHFTFIADTDEERVAVGIAAVELRANAPQARGTVDSRCATRDLTHWRSPECLRGSWEVAGTFRRLGQSENHLLRVSSRPVGTTLPRALTRG